MADNLVAEKLINSNEDSLERIFGAVLVGGIDIKDEELKRFKSSVFKSSLNGFKSKFTKNLFVNEYAFFYDIIKKAKCDYFTIPQLEQIIDNNMYEIVHSNLIDLSKWNGFSSLPASDVEKVKAFKENVIDKYKYLSNLKVDEKEFETSCNLYISQFLRMYEIQTVENMYAILSEEGFYDPGSKKHLQGIKDKEDYRKKRDMIVRELSGEDSVSNVLINEHWLENEIKKDRSDYQDDDKVMTFGLKEIDDVIGNFRRGQILGILGAPKGGKTRTAIYLAERGLRHKRNVAIWPLEGSINEWTSAIVASEIRHSMAESGIKIEDIVRISSKKIIDREFFSEDVKARVVGSKTKVALSQDRGRLSFIKGVAYLENMIDVLEAHYIENPFDILIIDSPVHILSDGSDGKRRGKAERISEAYTLLKNYLNNKMKLGAFGIFPAQLKQDTIDYLRKNPDETIDITAGGESAETIRTPDYVIGLMSTKEERRDDKQRYYDVATRHSTSFTDFVAHFEFDTCYAYSDARLNYR